jgi:hypothetical protein
MASLLVTSCVGRGEVTSTLSLLLLLRHNLFFDLVVGRLWNDLLLGQLILPRIGTPVDDLVRYRLINLSQGSQLTNRRGINVQ